MILNLSRVMLASLGVNQTVEILLLVFSSFLSTCGAYDVFVIRKSKGKIKLHPITGHEDTEEKEV